MIEITPRIAALLEEGFDLAGDGGNDPYTSDQRDEVKAALWPYQEAIQAEYAKIEALRREEQRLYDEWRREQERARLRRELADLEKSTRPR